MQKAMPNLVYVVCSLAIVWPAFGGQRIGQSDTYWGAHGLFQYWVTVSDDPNKRHRVLRGTIKYIEQNIPVDLPEKDGDWNIYVEPDSQEDRALLVNSHGIPNFNGQIELELYTLFPLSAHFKTDDYIEAYGWHVEDMGHDPIASHIGAPASGYVPGSIFGGKTELHPLIYIRKGNDSDFKIFLGQDGSSRFSVARVNLDNYFPGFTVPVGGSTRVNLASGTSVPSVTHVLSEQSIVDYAHPMVGYTPSYVVGIWNEQRTRVTAEQRVGSVQFLPSLKPHHALLNPLYFAHITKTTYPLITENIVTWVATEASGKQAIVSRVEVELRSNTQIGAALQYGVWEYDETFGSANRRTTTENPLGQRVVFDAIYAPHSGLSVNEWTLDVLASTRPRNWTPGERRTQTEVGLSSVQPRVFAQEQRIYFVTRSSLSVSEHQITKEFPTGQKAPGGKETSIRCMVGAQYKHSITKPHPDVRSEGMSWHVALVRNASGTDVAQVPQAVPTSGVLDLGNVFLERDTNGDLTITFGSMGGNNYNPAILNLYGVATTGLGEILPWTKETVGLPTCIPTLSVGIPKESDLQKLYLAYLLLKKLGLPPTVPPKWQPQLLKAWPSQAIYPLGPPYKWQRNLPKEGQELVATYWALAKGRRVDSRLVQKLNSTLALAATLPDIRFIQPPTPVPSPVGRAQPLHLPQFGAVVRQQASKEKR